MTVYNLQEIFLASILHSSRLNLLMKIFDFIMLYSTDDIQTPDLKDLVLAVVISCVLLKLVFGKDEGQDGQSSSFRKKYLICFLYEGYIGGIFTVVLYLILTSRV